MYENDETDFPSYFQMGPNDPKPGTPDKPKADPKKFDTLAVGYIEHRAARGEYPMYFNGKLYHYTGTNYAHEPEPDHAVRTFLRETGRGQSNNLVGNVRPVIESYCRKPVTRYPSLPFYTGADSFPHPKNVIGYTNGLLDLTDPAAPKPLPHSPKWCSTCCLPFNFDPGAACPEWLQFLAEVFDGDADRAALLQEWFGYCLTTDTGLHTALIQVGKPRSGKGTTQRVLQALIGQDNWTAFTLPQLASEFGTAALDGRQVAFVGEVELSGHPQKTVIMERLKAIIGEDPVSINEKYEKARSVKLPTRFTVACNELPTFHDASGGIGQRFTYLHYQKSFAGREDRGLEGRLLAELPGINNWALAGLARLRKAGGRFTVPGTAKKLAEDFSFRSNPIHCFVRDRLTVHRAIDPGDIPDIALSDKPDLSSSRDAVYKAYQDWCGEHDIQAKEVMWFGRDLSNALPKMQDARPKVNGVRVRVYSGIGLKAAQEAPDPTPPASRPDPEATPNVSARPTPATVRNLVRVAGMPADLPGYEIDRFGHTRTTRVRYEIAPERYAALDPNTKGRLRRSSPGVHFADVADSDVMPAGVGKDEGSGGGG